MEGFRFSKYEPDKEKPPFERLLDIFKEVLLHTSGNLPEALDWMNHLDRQYNLTNDDYGMGDFIEELKKKGYIKEDDEQQLQMTPKVEREIRRDSLNKIFGKLKKGKRGNHSTKFNGQGDETGMDKRAYEFGDPIESISLTDSIRNAQVNHGAADFRLEEGDLEVYQQEYRTQTSTVLMIDISHSMILYGEDRITPAKKVALALSELIKIKYPKDTLDVLVFGNDAWPIKVTDIPYLQVGPFHTNTVAGLELAMDLLRRRKTPNKQIFMITDGKPTCLKEGDHYYKNSNGLDRKIVNKTLALAAQCRRLRIPITTFMLASDSWLQSFVEEFTETNGGRAFYTGLEGLGDIIFADYERNRIKKTK
jgi:Ca-activated chloride channel family protein